MKVKRSLIKLLLMVFLCVSASLRFNAQVRPINDYGALGLGHLLKRLNTTASVMMIGAHPDDEDSALLAYLARGEAARTAYLSLTRGEGGQNLIGPELFEPLGIIRTEELLQARRLDGAEQYFTRAYDFGFSKTLAEAKSKWPEDVIKCDVVRAIRLFRPMVVISRFTGTPADGHGHHQYAGYISPIAVKAASDPKQCTDAGEPWQVLKFYVEQSFSDKTEPTLKINTGQYDPLLGRTYFEIAMEGRSMHRSQGEGRIERHGDQYSGLNLVASQVPGSEQNKSIFGGIDTSIAGLSKLATTNGGLLDPKVARGLDNAQQTAAVAFKSFEWREPWKIRSILLDGGQSMLQVLEGSPPPPPRNPSRTQSSREDSSSMDVLLKQLQGERELRYFALERYGLFSLALSRAIGFQFDALSDVECPVPGDTLKVTVKAFFPLNSGISVKKLELSGPKDWIVSEMVTESTAPLEIARSSASFTVKIPASAPVSQPYWLSQPRTSDVFTWPESVFRTRAFDPPVIAAVALLDIDGCEMAISVPVEFRTAEPARGEIRREVSVVPALSVGVDRDLLIVPRRDKPQVKRLVVSVMNNTFKEQSGNVSLNIASSPEWKVAVPNSSTFTLKTKGAKASVPFDITVPANTPGGAVPIRASAEVGQARYALTMNVVSYPHIQTHRYYTNADANVEVLDLKTAPLKVGYIMGSGDEVPEAIRQMGMDVTMLEEKDLASGDLSRFDTIVVGIRASETRPDLVANNARLLEYAKNGGTVIIQYQRGNWTGLAPFPVDTRDKQGTAAGSINRVVDENAKVTILEPQHAIFNFPNKVTDADFSGWVQERNAYNLVTFDPQYTPLLESHDAGEQENKGGLVIAKVGKGNWVYCSYSFFRQLPAGVPGAYRLFANLLSLPKAR
jgi:LmbE family N-acetylglucosaminyl deacetylase